MTEAAEQREAHVPSINLTHAMCQDDALTLSYRRGSYQEIQAYFRFRAMLQAIQCALDESWS